MPKFDVVTEMSDLTLAERWEYSNKFDSRHRIVERSGREYRLISKMEREYSFGERLKRGSVGFFLALFVIPLFFKSVRQLFTKENAVQRFAVKVINRDDLVSSREEFQEGIEVSEESIEKVKTFFAITRQQKKEMEGLNPLTTQNRSDPNVFTLDSEPEYVFTVDSAERRYDEMVLAHTVCKTYNLTQLVIPNAKLFEVEVNGRLRYFIAEKKIVFHANQSQQERLFFKDGSTLDDAIRQLAFFICRTGYHGFEQIDNPVLDHDGSVFFENKKIALLDFNRGINKDESQWGVERGLFGSHRGGLASFVSEEQAEMVREVAVENGVDTTSFKDACRRGFDARKRLDQIKVFHERRGIVTGKERLEIDIYSLDLDLNEEVEDRDGKVHVMGDVVADIIDIINSFIEYAPEEDTPQAIRKMFFSFPQDCRLGMYFNGRRTQKYSTLGWPSEPNYDLKYEGREKILWLNRVLSALVEKGHLFDIHHQPDIGGYFIQG